MKDNETEFANTSENAENEDAVRPVTDDSPRDYPNLRCDWKYAAFYGLNVALDETTRNMNWLLAHVGFEADNETIMNAMHALEGSLHIVERILENLIGMSAQLMKDEDKEKSK